MGNTWKYAFNNIILITDNYQANTVFMFNATARYPSRQLMQDLRWHSFHLLRQGCNKTKSTSRAGTMTQLKSAAHILVLLTMFGIMIVLLQHLEYVRLIMNDPKAGCPYHPGTSKCSSEEMINLRFSWCGADCGLGGSPIRPIHVSRNVDLLSKPPFGIPWSNMLQV